MCQNYLIIIAGPTGIGKSKLSLNLAKKLQCDIIGADSRQIYKEMNIGTAKATKPEQKMVKHWLVDSHSIHNQITSSQYEKEALTILDKIFEFNNIAILTGGTGLYIKSIVEGLDNLPPPNETLRNRLENGFQNYGLEYLQKELKKLAPEIYNKIDYKNSRRLIRAIEIANQKEKPVLSKQERNFQTISICLTMDREKLYQNINTRVDGMIENGLLDEVKNLLEFRELRSLQTVGYQELFDYLDEKTSLPEAIELIKRNSRRYAKRQITWFNNQGEWQYFNRNDEDEIFEYISNQLGNDTVMK